MWRRNGLSSATFYRWNATFGEGKVSDGKRLKALEHENSWLKRMDADLSLENLARKGVLAKKALGPAERREVGTYLVIMKGFWFAAYHAGGFELVTSDRRRPNGTPRTTSKRVVYCRFRLNPACC